MRARDELEKLINGSPLFSIDRTIDVELFVAEERKLLSDLAVLMEMIRKDFAEIGFEIIETARACIKAYKSENGVFLNYFNTALARVIRTAKAKEMAANTRGGMTVDKKTEQTIRQILKLAKTRGKDIYDKDFQKRVSVDLGYPVSAIEDAILANEGMMIVSGSRGVVNKDGDETELFDFVAAEIDTAEDKRIKIDAVREFVLSIDEVFKAQQERMKPLLSGLLTTRLVESLEDAELIKEVVVGLTFVDNKIVSDYIKHGTAPTAREIAEVHGVFETSASRTLKTFIDKIPRKC